MHKAVPSEQFLIFVKLIIEEQIGLFERIPGSLVHAEFVLGFMAGATGAPVSLEGIEFSTKLKDNTSDLLGIPNQDVSAVKSVASQTNWTDTSCK